MCGCVLADSPDCGSAKVLRPVSDGGGNSGDDGRLWGQEVRASELHLSSSAHQEGYVFWQASNHHLVLLDIICAGPFKGRERMVIMLRNTVNDNQQMSSLPLAISIDGYSLCISPSSPHLLCSHNFVESQ